MIYLDNSSTTRPYDEVIDYMIDIQREHFGNPSSAHTMGQDAEKLVSKASDQIAESLNTNAKNIIFTSGGTESNNTALMEPYWNLSRIPGSQIITSSVEHPAISDPCDYLESQGAKVSRIPVDGQGLVDIDKYKEMIADVRSDGVSIVSVMMVNNEVGTIQPVSELSRICKTKGDALFHTDAVQAYGKLPVDLNSEDMSGVDYLSISAHKIHGPKGTGALFMRSPEKTKPLIRGGGQQRNYRSGTEDVSGIAGFGLASSIQHENLIENNKKIGSLRNLLLDGLRDSIPNIRLNSPEEISLTREAGKCVPHILSVSFLGTKGEVILHSLEQKNIFVSTMSACSSKKNVQSPVLSAMGMNDEEIEGTIRFSLSRFNTEEEILSVVEETANVVKKFRKLTGYKCK